MHLCDFKFHRPQSVPEACDLAARYGTEAVFLAGGTEILPDLKAERYQAGHLISLRDVPGLRRIKDDGDFLRIGAMARLEEIVRE